jgi:hypothetical protein
VSFCGGWAVHAGRALQPSQCPARHHQGHMSKAAQDPRSNGVLACMHAARDSLRRQAAASEACALLSCWCKSECRHDESACIRAQLRQEDNHSQLDGRRVRRWQDAPFRAVLAVCARLADKARLRILPTQHRCQ